VRCAVRNWLSPNNENERFGFRVVLSTFFDESRTYVVAWERRQLWRQAGKDAGVSGAQVLEQGPHQKCAAVNHKRRLLRRGEKWRSLFLATGNTPVYANALLALTQSATIIGGSCNKSRSSHSTNAENFVPAPIVGGVTDAFGKIGENNLHGASLLA
jgi:hypothetical protein